jgi:iron complex outermembrane receptor protein
MRTALTVRGMGLLLLAGPLAAHAQTDTLDAVVVTAPRLRNAAPTTFTLKDSDLAAMRPGTSDSARLLQDVPGLSLQGAGGISSLPVIHGLADDRVRIQVNGVDLMAACPNHMNSALSYIAPADVGAVKVYAGITPVSVGGDSLGGTIQVSSAPPVFAAEGEGPIAHGQAGVFYRSNGQARGGNLSATWASERLQIGYSANAARAGNYKAARGFKAEAQGSEGGALLASDEVGSTAYKPINQELSLAWRQGSHLLQLSLGEQRVLFEGFPNQRMDMTANQNTLGNLRYLGQFDWGDINARLYRQQTHHEMDMGPDRYSYGTGMPMLTKAYTNGGQLAASVTVSEQSALRAGAEFQRYTLYDWWPPVGGSMGPNAFWNVDDGRRNKADAFAEWEARWSERWASTIGLRHSTVWTDAAAVQGYNNGMAALWGSEAAAFNARSHRHTDGNWDLTALARATPNASQAIELGYAHKTRSPSLYQRYPWSTQPMAALMNNFVGDGNGYVGNEALKPEAADTLSVAGEWQDAANKAWHFKAASYLTYVRDYIDAERCRIGQCDAANASTMTGFVLLQYANQHARLYGADLSGDVQLARGTAYGSFTATGVFSYVRGDNLQTGEPLYNIMPPDLKLSLVQSLGNWTNTAQAQWVAGKKRVSAVRNEVQTGGYSLLNLRTSYTWRQARFDAGVDNVFNRFYSQPLGGAYVGQGASMSSQGVPWGVPMPGMGRSLNLAMSIRY